MTSSSGFPQKLSSITTIPVAIFGASLVVGAAIIGSSYLDRYEIVTTVSNDSPLAWRLNRQTGEVVPCEVVTDPFGQLIPGSRPVDKIAVECGN
jgi:hypothetical protein